MNYVLPDNPDVYAVKAQYNDYKGNPMIVQGSYLSNSMTLNGFIDEQENIPLSVTLIDRDGNSSAPVNLEFSVLKSAAKAIFDNLEVKEYWSGFQVKYTAPEETKGFIHVGNIGINPLTEKTDTLLIDTYPIKSGENKLNFPNVVETEPFNTDVVIWTEDYKGNIVHKKVFMDVPALKSGLMSPDNFVFEGPSYENDFEETKTSVKYLFDGDKNGVERLKNATSMWDQLRSGCYCFLSGEYSVPGEWILDIQEDETIAGVRIYCPLNSGIDWPWLLDFSPESFMANHVKVYFSKDKINWVEKGEFHEYITTEDEYRWCYPLYDFSNKYTSVEALENADPACISIDFDYSEEEYRYIKFEILEVFKGQDTEYPANQMNQVMFSELEVYVKQ